MSNFVIFEDHENLHENGAKALVEGRKERQMFAPLKNKGVTDENAFENQVRNNFPCRILCL